MNQENQNIEHKRIWKDEYLKWICAISLNDIADKLGIGTTTVDREIKKLSAIIKRVGPRNGGHWEIIG